MCALTSDGYSQQQKSATIPCPYCGQWDPVVAETPGHRFWCCSHWRESRIPHDLTMADCSSFNHEFRDHSIIREHPEFSSFLAHLQGLGSGILQFVPRAYGILCSDGSGKHNDTKWEVCTWAVVEDYLHEVAASTLPGLVQNVNRAELYAVLWSVWHSTFCHNAVDNRSLGCALAASSAPSSPPGRPLSPKHLLNQKTGTNGSRANCTGSCCEF